MRKMGLFRPSHADEDLDMQPVLSVANGGLNSATVSMETSSSTVVECVACLVCRSLCCWVFLCSIVVPCVARVENVGVLLKMSERQTKAGNQECFAKLAKPAKLSHSNSLTLDMLNSFCFHVELQCHCTMSQQMNTKENPEFQQNTIHRFTEYYPCMYFLKTFGKITSRRKVGIGTEWIPA